MAKVPAYRANDAYETLIANMMIVERQPQLKVREAKSEQERMRGVLSDFDSTLSALHTELKNLTGSLTNPFQSRTGFTASTAFTVAASDAASLGSHAIQVERLAAADTRVSRRYDTAGPGAESLRAFFGPDGEHTFTIEVAHPTDADPARREAVSITVKPTGTDNKAILTEIADAVSGAMAQAVSDGRINQREAAQLSVVSESSGAARLSLRSGQTGYAGRLGFGASALVDELELAADAPAVGAGGGQILAVGGSETDSALTSKFTLDGLTLYRNTNTVSDALKGVTLTLKKGGEPASEFSVDTNTDAIKAKVGAFIQKYNAVLTHIENKTAIDSKTGKRGDLAGDSTLTSLRFDLRNYAMQSIGGQAAGMPASLRDLGITTERNGALTLSDEAKLLGAVQKNPDAVKNVFAAPDGVATRMFGMLDGFVKTGGVMDQRLAIADDRIKHLGKRVTDWDDKLNRRENELRKQFAKFQETIALLQGQQQGFLNLV